MTEEPEHDLEREAAKRPRVSRWAVLRSVFGTVFGLVIGGAVLAGALAVFHPDTPLPRAWNPTARLSVEDSVTPLTMWKLRRTVNDPELCLATLTEATTSDAMAPLTASETCHIRNRVHLRDLGDVGISDLETSCETALRTAIWTEHGVQPAAQEILGVQVSGLRHVGSYNCRRMNTSSGASSRWSTHATADAIDITGFDLSNGTRIRLIDDWQGNTDEATFLRRVRDAACDWFGTTLGPEFNRLHADHFHLQARGRGTCR